MGSNPARQPPGGDACIKVPCSPMPCLISAGLIRRGAYERQISFLRTHQSDQACSLPSFHTLLRLKKENRKESKVGRNERSKLGLPWLDLTPKTGRTKSEFRDICQNKLLQLSVNIIHHFSVYFLFFLQREKLMTSLLNFCYF